jgi:hypothetical protein
MRDQPSWPAVVMTTLRLWLDRRGRRIGRRGAVSLTVLLIAGLVTALCVVLVVRPGPTSASVRTLPPGRTATPGKTDPPAKPVQHPTPAELQAEAALRSQAAAWIAQQVSPAAIVSCDPAMCSALQAHGVPSSQLLVLVLADADPLGSDVVVATSVVRSQFGTRLVTVYAPEVIASFGSGAERIDVRAIAPAGAAAYQSALASDSTARTAAGGQLLRNKRITASPGAKAMLNAGDVDPRLLVTLAGLAATQQVSLVSFGDPSPGAAAVPLREAEIQVATSAEQRTALSFLRAQQALYLPAFVKTVHTKSSGDHFTIDIEYDAPGPLGLGGEL